VRYWTAVGVPAHGRKVVRIWCTVLFDVHFSRLLSGCWMRMKSPVSVRTPSRTSRAWTCCKLSLNLRLWNCLLRDETWNYRYVNCGWWITERLCLLISQGITLMWFICKNPICAGNDGLKNTYKLEDVSVIVKSSIFWDIAPYSYFHRTAWLYIPEDRTPN
jgi:hypothetical protein